MGSGSSATHDGTEPEPARDDESGQTGAESEHDSGSGGGSSPGEQSGERGRGEQGGGRGGWGDSSAESVSGSGICASIFYLLIFTVLRRPRIISHQRRAARRRPARVEGRRPWPALGALGAQIPPVPAAAARA